MAISSFAQLLYKLANPTQALGYCKSAQIATGTHWNSEWIQNGQPVAATTPSGAASIPDNTTTGSLGQSNKAGTEQRAWIRRYGEGGGGGVVGGMIALVDRLAHKGGLDGTLNTTQTVSTPALTRFTSGVDVWAAIEIYVQIGASGTTATASYTNDAGTSGQVTQPIGVGGAGLQNPRVVLPLSLAAGDKGVQAVASVTLAASTALAGNFGITLFKTLGMWPYNTTLPFPHGALPIIMGLPMPAIPDGACLQLLHFGSGQVNSVLTAEILFFED